MPKIPSRLRSSSCCARLFLTALMVLGIVLVAGQGLAGQGQLAWVQDELLVGLRPGVSRTQAAAMYHLHGAQLVQELPQINVHRIRVPAAALSAVEQALARRPAVRFVDRNLIHPHTFVPNDPSYGNEWHLPKIAAPQAWDVTQGAAGIVIAILDSGVDPTHPDLAAKLVAGTNTYDGNTDTRDVYGHGTKVAGAAAATGNNGTGVAGVAMANKIMPIRVTDTAGYAYSSTLANGLTWAADHGAKVMNMSFGGVAGNSTIKSAAQYAQSKGALVVAAAGNCGCLDSTAENPYMISVSATDGNDNLASWSSYGPYVDLAAPGVSILTTSNGGGYGSVSGTSFASPITAGVIGLMMAAKPGLKPSDYETLLKQNADDKGAAGYESYYGWGRVNAARAVSAAAGYAAPPDTTPPAVSIAAPAPGSTVAGSVTVDVSASDSGGVTKVDLYLDGALFAADLSSPYSFYWDTTQAANSTHTLLAKATDAAGNVGASTTVSVTVNNVADTAPPTVTIASTSMTKTKLAVTVNAQDDVGVVKVELYVDGRLKATSTAPPVTFNVNTRNLAKGTHTLEAKAYDASGKVGVSPQTTFTK